MRVRDLHPTNKRECNQLALEVADIRFKVVALPHLNGEEMVVVSLSLPQDAYLVRNALDISSKLWRECRGRE